jgi:hypothetical protein
MSDNDVGLCAMLHTFGKQISSFFSAAGQSQHTHTPKGLSQMVPTWICQALLALEVSNASGKLPGLVNAIYSQFKLQVPAKHCSLVGRMCKTQRTKTDGLAGVNIWFGIVPLSWHVTELHSLKVCHV